MDAFHPVIRDWFRERIGPPTDVQARAWPRIAAGRHVLAIAPTGSGKTLTAFLWALDRLLTGAWETGATRVLYVSPLRALNNDVQRNLLRPLGELHAAFADAGIAVPAVRVLTRSGDTSQDERRLMARRPPEILVTTPESVNVMLTSAGGRALLGNLATVVLDEVHAVAGNKRGVLLATALERLVRLSGEFQRIALSATVEPPAVVGRWVGGHTNDGPRPVEIVTSGVRKAYDLEVRYPAASLAARPGEPEGDDTSVWPPMVAEVKEAILGRRSTLVFTNSRRTVEKLTRLVNEDEAKPLVWAHHGSLAREVRRDVEERLKRGELAGIVATNSLELGIDVGALDQVLLVQTPPSLAAAAQRIGRAGHAVGAVSRARFLPLVARDLVESAVVARGVEEGLLEPVRPIRGALDVLAQVIVSMTATETWTIDELFAALHASDAYHELARRPFELVLEMLGGRYASARVPGLAPVVSIDRLAGTVRGLPGAARRVYLGGGTIPDRGYFHLRRADSGALVGELDEEFVWERAVGDAFTLGVQTWRIERITHNDVLVTPAPARQALAPFWRADARDRGFTLADRVGRFLEEVEPRLGDATLVNDLQVDNHMDRAAAQALIDYLALQRDAVGKLPHRHRIVAERTSDPGEASGSSWLILHTTWGGAVNRPLALAIAAAWERTHGGGLEIAHDDGAVVLGGVPGIDAADVLGLVHPDALEELLRQALGSSGYFGARFREAAGTALILPRAGFNRRTPLWLSRQRAKELLDAVRGHDDFPVVLEAWRSCLADSFELEALRRLLIEVEEGHVEIHRATTALPSPFASNVVWRRTNELMYEDDVPRGAAGVRADLLREAVFDRTVRPRVPQGVAEEFRQKLQRVAPGYAPRGADELFSWVQERRLVPLPEWHELLGAMQRDHAADAAELGGPLGARVAAVLLADGDAPRFVAAVQDIPGIASALGRAPKELVLLDAFTGGARAPERAQRGRARAASDALHALAPDADGNAPTLEALVADLLRFEGPVPYGFAAEVLGLDRETHEAVLAALGDAQGVVVDALTEPERGVEAIDASNLERLLRIARARARPAFGARPAAELPLFLATWQRLGEAGAGPEAVAGTLERLAGFLALANLWETELLPARCPNYQPAWLDAVLAEGDIAWFGTGTERLTFGPAAWRALWSDAEQAPAPDADAALLERLFPTPNARFRFEDLLANADGTPSAELAARLWGLAWRGDVSADGFGAVRRGIETGFKAAAAQDALHASPDRVHRRLRFERWKSTRPFAGTWFRAPAIEPAGDPMEQDALARDRARLLLERYGIVFRELLQRELPALQWGRVFRALRLLELSGEAVAGQFFLGVPGLQFMSNAAFRRLSDGLDRDRLFAVNALDPASPAGIGLDDVPGSAVRRVPSNRLVFLGSELLLRAEASGKRLELGVAPDDPRLSPLLALFLEPLVRAVRPERTLKVEAINGVKAPQSPYLSALSALCRVERDVEVVLLSKR